MFVRRFSAALAVVLALWLVQARAEPPKPAPDWSRLQAPARTGLGQAWQRVRLRVGQASRQAKLIAGNPGLTRGRRVARAASAWVKSLCSRRSAPVLLYQGAFDPVHKGHLTNLRAAVSGVKGVCQVYVVPTSSHPGKRPVAHRHRVAMMRAALADAGLPQGVKVIVVEDPQLARLSAAGFDDLTQMIHSRHPGASVHIMTGADAFASAVGKGLVQKARRWGYRYAVTPRAGYALPARLPEGVTVTPMAGGRESSTRARAHLAKGLAAPDLTQGTLRYIHQHGLYAQGQEAAP